MKESLRFCRSLPHATEDVKWGNDLCFSVGGKMFAVFDLEDTSKVSFKTTPALFEILTAKKGVEPAAYVARYHWVTVTRKDALSRSELKDLISESYRLVKEKLPAKLRKKLG